MIKLLIASIATCLIFTGPAFSQTPQEQLEQLNQRLADCGENEDCIKEVRAQMKELKSVIQGEGPEQLLPENKELDKLKQKRRALELDKLKEKRRTLKKEYEELMNEIRTNVRKAKMHRKDFENVSKQIEMMSRQRESEIPETSR